ncbi:hypothetical protein RJT34_15883 [Clitoria ternatea]|uniref:U-box domain-containing protein 12 n=1 Tax=Clitoria ternatea TaxID=43366 RepID=A0AAN9J875_CLITE
MHERDPNKEHVVVAWMSMEETQCSQVLQNLTTIANQISNITSFKSLIKPQCSDLTRRIRFLAPLFQELQSDVVPYHVLSSLEHALLNAKDFLDFATRGSQLFMVLEREHVKCKFGDVSVRFEDAINKISLDELDISEEVKEQVELVTAQFRRAKEQFDPPGFQLYEHLLSVYNQGYDVYAEAAELRLICEKLQFINVDDVKQESLSLQKMVGDRDGHSQKSICDMSLFVLKKIEDFLVTESGNNIVLSTEDFPSHTDEPCLQLCLQSLVIPDEFRCPISLELMKDPVIICTGQTYERSCIKKWLEAGHGTCPKTQQFLSSPVLIPNHVLYSLISNWCEANGVEPPKRFGNLRFCKTTSDGSSSELIDLDVLMSKLASSNTEDQRCATGELRLLAKYNSENRILIAEAGAIPLLVDLLYVPDTATQEHAVTALLNLSIYEDNKKCIMVSEAVQGILHVLENGSMEARENAAATFFSLSAVDENKVAIGASGAIQPLVTLFCEGSQRGKMDAASALFNLCLYQGNKGRAVKAGIVPKLIEMLTEPGGAMRDEALTLTALVVGHPDGKAAIRSMNIVTTFVELIRNGSPRSKENATSVLVHLCSGDPLYVSIVSSLGVINPLLELAENGSERAQRKAAQLLELIDHCEY